MCVPADVMGLASGDHGVKTIVKQRYAAATVVANSLTDAVRLTGTPRDKAVIVLDGNVLLMQVPQQAASFCAYVGIASSAIKAAMANASLVVVVFDEPQCISVAKAEEQRRRDAARSKTVPLCSLDLTPHPSTDSYGKKELFGTSDCHAIVRCRPARQRFFDAVGIEIMSLVNRTVDKWAEGGHESVLLFDGLDPAGADRPIGQKRAPGIWGTDDAVAALFQREQAIGEGDLKLLAVEQRVRELVKEEKIDVELYVVSTIDTDSIAISLLDDAKRAGEAEPDRDVKSMLAFRERASKRDIEDGDARATYFCVDVACLSQLVQRDMWAMSKKEPTPVEARCAMALMAAGWAMSGSDFVKTPGLHARMVFEAVPAMLATCPRLVELMQHSWGDSREGAKLVQPALRRLLLLCAGNYAETKRARKKTIEGLRNYEPDVLLRACWTVAYWCGEEHTGSLEDFGFSEPASSADAVFAAAAIKACTDPMPWEPPPKVVSRFFADAARKQDRIEGEVVE